MPDDPVEDDGVPGAVPGVDPAAGGRRGPVLLTLDVDGEQFAVRRSPGGGTDYDWLSGRNEGYGFGCSGDPERSADEHRQSVRGFLDMIDPASGHIAED